MKKDKAPLIVCWATEYTGGQGSRGMRTPLGAVGENMLQCCGVFWFDGSLCAQKLCSDCHNSAADVASAGVLDIWTQRILNRPLHQSFYLLVLSKNMLVFMENTYDHTAMPCAAAHASQLQNNKLLNAHGIFKNKSKKSNKCSFFWQASHHMEGESLNQKVGTVFTVDGISSMRFFWLVVEVLFYRYCTTALI